MPIDAAEVWQDLYEALRLSLGAAVLFVIHREGESRRRAMERLRLRLEGEGRSVCVVPFSPEHLSLVATLVRAMGTEIGAREASVPPVVFVDVRGVEVAQWDPGALAPGPLRDRARAARRALQALNLERERLAALGFPLVFWVDRGSFSQIVRFAADVFATRTGIFDPGGRLR